MQAPLPPFEPVSVIGRKAKRIYLSGNGETRYAYNIIPHEALGERVYQFAKQALCPLLRGTNATFVPILNGAINFYSELSQHVSEGSTVQLMSVQASCYGFGQTSGKVTVNHSQIIREKVRGRTLVVLDDILDTGATLAEVVRLLKLHQPERIISVVLARKMHEQPPPLAPDYHLFAIHPESWAFGFGLDIGEKYRHLRFVCDDNEALYDRSGNPTYDTSQASQ